MAVCEICGEKLTYGNTNKYSKELCITCSNKEQFKKDIDYIMDKIKYIQNTYGLTYNEAIGTMKLYLLEDNLYKIASNADSIASAVAALE